MIVTTQVVLTVPAEFPRTSMTPITHESNGEEVNDRLNAKSEQMECGESIQYFLTVVYLKDAEDGPIPAIAAA